MDISTTAHHYATQNLRITVALGKYLDPTIKPAELQAAGVFRAA